MPIRELTCPRCGTGVEMALPAGATVTAVTADGDPTPAADREKVRELRCPNGHEFEVLFRF